ncbi:hypothetical protein K1719_046820 [Acacia pycnantha]|nr:hypothetical protein K1719_046820 [Acacia pycnantha]
MQENIPIEEVFENLTCSREGLTSDAVEQRLAIFGWWKPLSWVMEAAAIMTITLANGGGDHCLLEKLSAILIKVMSGDNFFGEVH